MSGVDVSGARCFVYVEREGLAAAVGHDVKLAFPEFTLRVGEDRQVEAVVRTASLEVLGSVDSERRLKERGPSGGDRAEIAKNARTKVLETERYGEARFRSTAVEERRGGYAIRGRLEVHGREREVVVEADERDGELVARFQLHQPDFGIKPFKAMLGALKVKPDVLVEVVVPLQR
ncbi:MAG: YceI family protein [Deltaproteobacteria bacterium]|nr:YceI family protein [Deltaproteobacteria bacterium]MCB9786643.1 YceI family protein [Deltaproteobacteria bacterium]